MFWKKQKQPSKELLALYAEEGARSSTPVIDLIKERDVAIKQVEALATLSKGVADIAAFLNQGGIQSLLTSYTKGQIASSILGGMAAKDGRNSLDARTIKQNALEITEVMEAVFNKVNERAKEREPRNPEIKDAEE